MKKLAVISAVVFTTLALQSCRQSDDIMSPEEAATLQRVQDSSDNLSGKSNIKILNTDQDAPTTSSLEGEIAPPPKK